MATVTTAELAVQLQALKDHQDVIIANSNSFFLIVNALIIFLMQCGFAFLECGAVRSKNATNILIKNMLDSFIGSVAYWLIGYGLAFGDSATGFLGTTGFALKDVPHMEFSFFFFQFVFAATAATIVSGAVAERCDFTAYIIYSIVITGFIYPIVTHWAWNGGWLAAGINFTITDSAGAAVTQTTSFMDFAGSGVVHLTGGSCALVAAAILGPRYGKFDDEGKPRSIRGHSVPLAALGGFILFFGFFAFNGGSQASIAGAGDAEAVNLAIVNTIISGGIGGIVSMVVTRIVGYVGGGGAKWSLLSVINGALTGMVAICAGCNVVEPWGAAVIGVVSGFTFLGWSTLVLKMKVDDPLDAVAVHMGGGMWGLIATPILANKTGIFFKWDKTAFMALAWQLVGALAILAWAMATSASMFGLMRALRIFRIDEDMEAKGVDVPKHGEPAYPYDSYGDGWAEDDDGSVAISESGYDASRRRRPRKPVAAITNGAYIPDQMPMPGSGVVPVPVAVSPGYRVPPSAYYATRTVAPPYTQHNSKEGIRL